MTVHIVEDDFAVCDALTMLLSELGHEVAAYSTAEIFFETALPLPSDTVVVDLGLPGQAGTSVISRLVGMVTPPKVIIISGKPKNQLKKIVEGFAGLTVLRKPISFAALAEHFA